MQKRNRMNDKKKGETSPDRKTRVKGNRVIHTTKGAAYQGDRYERPRGLTKEQSEDQRVGNKLDERQVREAAQEKSAPSGRRTKTDELTTPFAKKKKKE